MALAADTAKRHDMLRMRGLRTEKSMLRQKNMRKIWSIQKLIVLLHPQIQNGALTFGLVTSRSKELKQASLFTR
jgi:hypothetical protein